MVIDIAILDHVNAEVLLVSCDMPDEYTNKDVEDVLEQLGYNIATTSYMTAINIELSDAR